LAIVDRGGKLAADPSRIAAINGEKPAFLFASMRRAIGDAHKQPVFMISGEARFLMKSAKTSIFQARRADAQTPRSL